MDSAGDVGHDTSLALDMAGQPHISYGDDLWRGGGEPELKYAHHDGTGWQTEVVDGGFRGGGTSLVVDATGQPHISYNGDRHLKYAYYNGSSWQIEVVDESGTVVGLGSSLVLDQAGLPHMSYYGNGELKYAYHNGSTWKVESVVGGVGRGGYSSLKLDQNDQPHIGYFDATNNAVNYAYYDGSSWQIEVLDTGLEPENDSVSLALDADGHPHICYSDYMDGELRYAYRAESPLLPNTGISVTNLWIWIGLGILVSVGLVLRHQVLHKERFLRTGG